MSKDKVNQTEEKSKDITWEELVSDATTAIETHMKTVRRLRKSLVFFREQIDVGAPFPKPSKESTKRHQELS
jgi:hypothetical protein